MINQVWLKTFCTLVEIGHFTKTAETLFMTQSGVSQHIKKLEKQLDCQLLVRQGKSFSLSNEGKHLHDKGLKLLRSAEDLEALIKQDDAHVGNIKVASPGSVGLKLYPHLLDIQKTHRKLSIDYSFAPNKSIENDLIDRKLDLGLITTITTNSNLLSEKIAEEPLVLVTSSEITSVSWRALLALGFISHPDAAHHGRLLLGQNFAEFEHIEQFPQSGFSNQISLILEPVSRGLGFTILPLFAARAYKPQHSIVIHNLATSVSESLYLCVFRQSTLPNRVKLIRSLVVDYLR